MNLQTLARRGLHFARRQTHNFKLMLVRRALNGLADNLSIQYDSIYAMLLGADPMQIGLLQSVGNTAGALTGLPAGWFIDYYSLKNIFLLGTTILVASRFLYLVAPHWTWLYVGIILYYLGMRITCTSCTVTCADNLANEERATGRGFCQAQASIVAVVTPMLAAWLISQFGGLRVEGIRPLYAVQTIIFLGIFVLLLKQFSSVRSHSGTGDGRQFFLSFTQVFKQGPDVVRMMLVMGLMELPWTMARPFMPVYAHDFKGANEFLLGAIAMASVLVPMLASIPLGRIADQHGRKKLLFTIAPLTYIAYLFLVFAPVSGLGSSLSLLLYGVLFGFNSISMALTSSMTAEVMPQEQMGRWIGVVSFFRGLVSIPAPILGGLLWERIGPQYVFFAAIAIDISLRLPLLAGVRETLHLTRNKVSAS
jgi:MFS family permease